MIGLNPSAYYYHPKQSRAERERIDADLRDAIESVQMDFPCAGYRTVQEYLERRAATGDPNAPPAAGLHSSLRSRCAVPVQRLRGATETTPACAIQLGQG